MYWIALQDAFLTGKGLSGGTADIKRCRGVLARFGRYVASRNLVGSNGEPIPSEWIPYFRTECLNGENAEVLSFFCKGCEQRWPWSDKAGTNRCYKCGADFEVQIKTFDVRHLTQQTVTEYLVARKSDISSRTKEPITRATLNTETRYLNPVFKHMEELPRSMTAVEADWKAPYGKRTREPKRIPRSVPDDLMDRVFQSFEYADRPCLPGFPPRDWWYCCYIVCYITGIRKRGLNAIKRPTDEQLDRNELFVSYEAIKELQDRLFYLPRQVCDLIKLMPVRPGEVLFDFEWSDSCFYDCIHRMQTEAGIPLDLHVLPHDLRRTKGTNLVRVGASLPIVQRELGHSSPTTTEKFYLGQFSQEQRTAIDQLRLPGNFSRDDAVVVPPAMQYAPVQGGNLGPGYTGYFFAVNTLCAAAAQ